MTAFTLFLLLASVHPFLQHPNLSGEWELQTPAQAAPEMARTLRVVQGATDISITRSSGRDRGTRTHSFGHAGTVGPPASGQSSGTSVWWFGDSLRFDEYSRSREADGSEKSFERHEVWSVDEHEVLTITATLRRSDAPVSRVRATYRKVKRC